MGTTAAVVLAEVTDKFVRALQGASSTWAVMRSVDNTSRARILNAVIELLRSTPADRLGEVEVPADATWVLLEAADHLDWASDSLSAASARVLAATFDTGTDAPEWVSRRNGVPNAPSDLA